MKNKFKKEIEYEDAPSGNVTFYNYKEPLMKFDGGFGFVGALVFDTETDKIQCHLCGHWFKALNSNHLRREHNMSAGEYKDIVGLNQSSALIGESMREKLIASGLDKRLQNLRNQKGVRRSEETREKIRQTLQKNTPEMQNLRNTCPAQLIERLRNQYIQLGHTPTEKKVPMRGALLKTYGTYRETCRIAGIPEPLQASQTYTNIAKKMTEEKVVDWVRNYVDIHGGIPISKDFIKEKAERVYSMYKTDKKGFLIKALGGDGKYRKQDIIIHYTKEQLLGFLRHFKAINNRHPSYSDCKRGLLPHLSRYSYHFGSWEKALAEAFKEEKYGDQNMSTMQKSIYTTIERQPS